MAQTGSVTQLLQQYRAGDEAALGELMKRYWPFLLARAGERLPRAYRRAADEEDVALEVVCALHRGFEDGRWQQLANRQDLVGLLNTITERRAINQLHRELAGKRGRGAIPEPLLPDTASGSGSGAVAEDPGPSPQAEVLLDDWCRHCLGRLGEELRPVAELLVAGHSRKEIATALGCSERTVARKIPLIRAKWLEFMAESDERVLAP